MSKELKPCVNDILGFCHRHPKMEDDFSLLPDHVIIDREDWEQVRGLTEKPESVNIMLDRLKCIFLKRKPFEKKSLSWEQGYALAYQDIILVIDEEIKQELKDGR